jgi:hypothetical protein
VELEAADRRRRRRRGENPDAPEAALDDVERVFRRLRRLIARSARKFDIDLEEVARLAKAMPAPDDTALDAHPLVREGMKFFQLTRALVKAARAELKTAGQDITGRAGFMDVQGEAAASRRIHEALEVLDWDASLVAVKTKRAVSRLFEDFEGPPGGHAAGGGEGDSEMDDVHLEDSEATTALVLRCLDRDQRALLALYDWSKDLQDTALTLLATVERMRRTLKQLFPGYVRHQFPPAD